MPQNQAADNFQTTLAAAATSSQTTLDLTSIAGAPSYPYLLALTPAGGSAPFSPYEVVQVTSLSSGTTVNVTRAVQGTASSWSSGDTATNAFTAGDANGLWQAGWPPDWTRMARLTAGRFANVTAAGSGSGGASYNEAFGGTIFSGATAGSNMNYRFQNTTTPPAGMLSQATGNGIGLMVWFHQVTQPVNSGDQLQMSIGNITLQILPSGVLHLSTPTKGATTLTATVNDTSAHVVLIHLRPGGLYDFWLDGAKTDSVSDGTDATLTGIPISFYAANGSSSTTNVEMAIWDYELLQGMVA